MTPTPPRRFVAGACAALAVSSLALAAEVDLPRFPAISPDGATIAFAWRGDLWRVPASGGAATRLTAHASDDLMPAWSPDGERLAFVSDRDGYANVWIMDADGGALRQVTDLDRPVTISAFGRDAGGRDLIWFDATIEGDVYRERRPYVVSPDGGAWRRAHDAFGAEACPSPDGTAILFTRGGYYDGWTRRGYRGAENADLWRFDVADGSFARLTRWEGNDGLGRWAGPETILFLSDRERDCVNLWQMSAREGEAVSVRLTDFTERDVAGFDVSADGTTVVLQVWDALWTLDLDDPAAAPRRVVATAPDDAGDRMVRRSLRGEISEAALSPDGTVLALVAFGEVFVRGVEEDDPPRRVTRTAGREKDVAWSVDGATLYFTSDEGGSESIMQATVLRTRREAREEFAEATGGASVLPLLGIEDEKKKEEPKEDEEAPEVEPEPETPAVAEADADEPAAPEDEEPVAEEPEAPKKAKPDAKRWADALAFEITPLVARESNDRGPRPSPDGTRLAFRGVRGELNVLDLADGTIATIRKGWDAELDYRWTPDSTGLLVVEQDLDFNADVLHVPADGAGPVTNLTRHPDSDLAPALSADGRVLVYSSERVADRFDVYRVFLDPALESLTKRELEQYFEAREKATAKPDDDEPASFAPAWSDAWRRGVRVTRLEGDELPCAILPAGDRFLYASSEGGVWAAKWDGSDPTKIAERGALVGVARDGKRVVLRTGGRVVLVGPDGKNAKTFDLDAEIDVDLVELADRKMAEAARGLGEGYYSGALNGLDWERTTADYRELARRSRTNEEFDWIANRFVGELNGSHLRVRSPGAPSPNREAHGRLGIDAEPVAGGFAVTRVLPDGPAADGPMALRGGDVIRSIEGEPIAEGETLDARLTARIGKETRIGIERDGATLEALVVPFSFEAERQLRYDTWRGDVARQVDEWSEGRIGYIHVQAMGDAALDVFERDLFAAVEGKEALLLDVRNNGGGWTTDRMLASIMAPTHAWTTPRGANPALTGHYPQPRLFIQHFRGPMSLLCNEKSYSNAEIMSHAFKTLERGTLVGMPTHGSVISTGGFALIDGTFVRLPFRGWYVDDGTGRDMELNGAVPDLIVEQTPEDEVRGEDAQLRAAVEELLGRLDG